MPRSRLPRVWSTRRLEIISMIPIVNERGERLLDVLEVDEASMTDFAPLTFALVLARNRSGFLLVLNRERNVWELPGGTIDDGESPRQCAMRELIEESGQSVRELRWRALMRLEVAANERSPHRHVEYGALFCGEVDAHAPFVPNDEVREIGFWPVDSLPEGASAIDACLLAFFR